MNNKPKPSNTWSTVSTRLMDVQSRSVTSTETDLFPMDLSMPTESLRPEALNNIELSSTIEDKSKNMALSWSEWHLDLPTSQTSLSVSNKPPSERRQEHLEKMMSQSGWLLVRKLERQSSRMMKTDLRFGKIYLITLRCQKEWRLVFYRFSMNLVM